MPIKSYIIILLVKSLRLLDAFLSGRAVKPNRNKCNPSSNGDPDTTNPDPGTRDLPTSWPLIVRKVTDGNLSFLFNVGQERPAVVDAEVEDAVLIGSLERGTENSRVCGLRERG